MVQATSSLGATNYQVNALGQRMRKTGPLGDSVFLELPRFSGRFSAWVNAGLTQLAQNRCLG